MKIYRITLHDTNDCHQINQVFNTIKEAKDHIHCGKFMNWSLYKEYAGGIAIIERVNNSGEVMQEIKVINL